MGEKTVRVKETVWKELMEIKLEQGKKNLNEVIETLLRRDRNEQI